MRMVELHDLREITSFNSDLHWLIAGGERLFNSPFFNSARTQRSGIMTPKTEEEPSLSSADRIRRLNDIDQVSSRYDNHSLS